MKNRGFAKCRVDVLRLHPLDDDGRGAAAAVADGGAADVLAVVLEEVREGGHDARAAAADGVAKRHRSAKDVHLLVRNLHQLHAARQHPPPA